LGNDIFFIHLISVNQKNDIDQFFFKKLKKKGVYNAGSNPEIIGFIMSMRLSLVELKKN